MTTVYIRFSARGSGSLQRAPVLERLLARSVAVPCAADWRAVAFRTIAGDGAPVPPVALAALTAASGPAASAGVEPGGWACVATPLHFVAGMTDVTLAPAGLLDLGQAAAERLAADFNRVFLGSGARLLAGRGAVLFCAFERALDVVARDPEELTAGDVFDRQPTGADAPTLRHLMSEVEMWLFEHPVNRLRSAEGLLPVTALWMWGGGAMPAAVPAVQGWTAGRDPLFAAFGAVTEYPGDGRSGVLVCSENPGSAGWAELERRFLEPVWSALRAGRIERVELSSAGHCFAVKGGVRLRFWRRPRPWWNSFDATVGEQHGLQ